MQMCSDHKKKLTPDPWAFAICYDELGLTCLISQPFDNILSDFNSFTAAG
jgi:hypothetical protein